MNRQAYQDAFAEASLELSEIAEQLEQLRKREELIERVMEALKPVIAAAEQVTAMAEQNVEPPAAASHRNFENRLDQALETGDIIHDPAFLRQNAVCFEAGRW
jgi:Asp-tRNA(Asn)/Glu-tRNA(Gln) amidotransferase C subunit